MIDSGDLGTDVVSLGELLGVLTSSDGSVSVNEGWFKDPLSSLEQIPDRLDTLVSIVNSVLGPALTDGPDVFSSAQWLPLPNPETGTPTPIYLVTSPGSAASGQVGLGVDVPIGIGNLTIQAFFYLPLFRYGPSGASFIADSASNPVQIGLYITTSDTFSTGGVTFTAVKIDAQIYLTAQTPIFSMTFEGLTGTTDPATYTTLDGVTQQNVIDWLAEVIVQGSYWLNTYIGSSTTTVGQVLVAANFLTQDSAAPFAYHFSPQSLAGQSPLHIAEYFAFAALDALANLEIPLIPLPGGGIFIAKETAGTVDTYGVRFAAALALNAPTSTTGTSSPAYTISLGTWLPNETSNATGWMGKILGSSPEPGLTIYGLQHDTSSNTLSFAPSFSLASVGADVQGGADAPLVNLDGYTLQGIGLRGYLDSAGWDYYSATLDVTGRQKP
jgi:hypothetical protein